MFNFITTGAVVDIEYEKYGFEGYVGLPLLRGIAATINSLSGSSTESYNFFSSFFLPSLMGNAYYKLINGDKFQLRLGLQLDSLIFLDQDEVRMFGLFGVSAGLDYKFSKVFSINFTAACPLFIPLYVLFGSDVSNLTFFYLSSEKLQLTDIAVFIIAGYGSVLDQFARLSMKWSF